MASNSEYEQQQFWEDKTVKWIHFTDSLGNNWSVVYHPLFDESQKPDFKHIKDKIKNQINI